MSQIVVRVNGFEDFDNPFTMIAPEGLSESDVKQIVEKVEAASSTTTDYEEAVERLEDEGFVSLTSATSIDLDIGGDL